MSMATLQRNYIFERLFMLSSVIDFWNSPLDLNIVLKVVIIWFFLWFTVIKKLLRKAPESSFWYELSEIGGAGVLGIIIFLSIPISLLVASIQIVLYAGIKMIFPLSVFWGLIFFIVIKIIKHIRNR